MEPRDEEKEMWIDLTDKFPGWEVRAAYAPLWWDINKVQDVELCDDLIQIRRFNVIIDMGWTPELDREGSFKITVVKNEDWDNPIRQEETQDPFRAIGLLLLFSNLFRKAKQYYWTKGRLV